MTDEYGVLTHSELDRETVFKRLNNRRLLIAQLSFYASIPDSGNLKNITYVTTLMKMMKKQQPEVLSYDDVWIARQRLA